MENITVIDTCALLDFLAGSDKTIAAKAKRLILEARAAISAITLFELLRGVESDKHIAQRQELIGLCTVLDVTMPISELAADMYTELRKKGTLIHMEDILIASTALHWRYPVLTSNTKDFSRVSNLKLE